MKALVMGQPLRFEDPERASHISSRTQGRRLWFVNNKRLENKMLGYTGRLQTKYDVDLYALVLMGNHFHDVAKFRRANRAPFMRDFKSQYQRYLKAANIGFEGGTLWSRRYDEQELPLDSDIEEYFWYAVLNPIRAGLCDNLKDYDGYNCFYDAICGIEREGKYFRSNDYHRAKKKNPNAKIKDYIETYKLKFKRLPGYEHLSQQEYKKMMLKKYAEKRIEAIKLREELGIRGAVPKSVLRRMGPGTRPKKAKKEENRNFRPLVLSKCPVTKQERLSVYFANRELHREASILYRAGDPHADFPPGTYKPPLLTPLPKQ